MKDWLERKKLDAWAIWCKVVDHRWEYRNGGEQCMRCWEWRPTYKQHFKNPKIS